SNPAHGHKEVERLGGPVGLVGRALARAEREPFPPSSRAYRSHTPMLVSKVRAFIRRHDLIPRGARVLAAVSGGSDSIALAHILLDLDREGDLQLAGIVHLNHQLRSAADTDEQFVRGV